MFSYGAVLRDVKKIKGAAKNATYKLSLSCERKRKGKPFSENLTVHFKLIHAEAEAYL